MHKIIKINLINLKVLNNNKHYHMMTLGRLKHAAALRSSQAVSLNSRTLNYSKT